MKRLLPLLAFLLSFPAAGAQSPSPSPAGQPPQPQSDTVVKLGKFEVSASQQTYLNSIDRKVYNVGMDIQGLTGSAADLLQNIPSVQVDVDGNVSLRGDANVQILLDGRPTALMGANRADALSQMPADSIERVEVITNPSAMYKADGTAGIINIVTKKGRSAEFSGSVHITAGNGRRFSAAASGSRDVGKVKLYGQVTLRQDDRIRVATDKRQFSDQASGQPATTQTATTEHSRPLYRMANGGIDFSPTKADKLGEKVTYSYRTFDRHSAELDTSSVGGTVTTVYDRLREDPEYERDVESKSTYKHDFGDEGHALTAEFRAEHHTETENNHYANVFGLPAAPTTYDNTKIFTNEPGTEATVEYSDPLGKDSKLELGYDRSDDKSNQDHFRNYLNSPGSLWTVDTSVTNRFVMRQTVQALYGAYSRALGNLGIEAGFRFEQTGLNTNQVTAAITHDSRYYRLYPSLHLAYTLGPTQQLQLNYSHRVRRPESDDLNPYPEYQDPYNLREGNPYLKPQETHSIEAGYQYKNDDTTYLTSLFYKYSYNGFTTVSRFLDATTLLTTEENLAKNQSGGLELNANTSPIDKLTINASGDLFYNQIDASNLGYTVNRSTFAWDGKFSCEYEFSKRTMVQLNANYTARRLTPQGYRMPTFVSNLGLKHELANRRVTLILTVSDLFNSLREETRLDTPTLRDDSTRRRSSRIVFVGFIYAFGASPKKPNGESLQFDNQL